MPNDACDDPVTAASAAELGWGDSTVELQTAIGCVDPGGPALQLNSSQEAIHAARQDFFNRPEIAVARIAGELHPEPVTMHDAAHLPGRDEDAVLHAFDAQEAVARTICAHDAFNDAGHRSAVV